MKASGSYDVIDVDVPYWPAFVSNDWIQPLNDRLAQSGNEVFQTSPAFFQALYAGLTEYGIGRPKIKGYFEWSSTMQKWLTRSITQGMDPQNALSNAADDTRQLLEEQGY